jgi:hypothetical protein
MYAAGRAGRQLLVMDGVEGKDYDGVKDGTTTFSADGEHWGFVAARGQMMLIVYDGKEGKGYDAIGTNSVVLSAVGGHAA